MLVGAAIAQADDIELSRAIPVANGSMVVMRSPDANPTRLLMHFHGDPKTVRAAYARSELESVLVVINFPGLSTAYSKPFSNDSTLFEQIQQIARTEVASSLRGAEVDWDCVSLSSFSAGYGALREILKTPRNFQQISGIVTADSIYAGLQAEHPKREVDESDMHDFQRFASLAAQGKKKFILSHSAQKTPYASTTETAEYLLRSLELHRSSANDHPVKSMHQVSQAQQGNFLVLGFDGTTGPEHMQHLHNIDLLWRQLSD
ncbi:hypothetical protein K239x_29330 [Planctomycetes bacterium K23_9]|uniref:Alpha/beta hydrolase family protein n=2 Tax=Stieleria marina TaxID=1930275 RepID=A0A517NUZ9_9BACT|nr:hypothetical protein K239x_29330 [Planctomycetes bacterium K23_9]